MSKNFLLSDCSFTDPLWQDAVPWSVHFSKHQNSYIVAKAGMGIKGICTEALYYLNELPDISSLIIILPDLWRVDVEVDEETYLCNAMVDLIYANNAEQRIEIQATRKWLISGGINYSRNTEQANVFNFLYKHQGFLVILKEHFRALKMLQTACKDRNITCYVSAIQDPLDQITGLDYIKDDIVALLNEVSYNKWLKFDGKFIDGFLQHKKHPTTAEHKLLCNHISKMIL